MEDRSLAEMPVVPQGLLRAAYDQAHRTRDYRCRHHPEILLRRGDSDSGMQPDLRLALTSSVSVGSRERCGVHLLPAEQCGNRRVTHVGRATRR